MSIVKPNNNTLSAITALPAAISTGKVLQVVNAKLETEESTTSTSLVSTSLAASITPSSSSNKVLILINAAAYINTSAKYYYATIYRGSTDLSANNNFSSLRSNASAVGSAMSLNFLDSPSTTSATTYTYYHKVDSPASGYLAINGYTSTISLLEIEA